MDLQIDRKPMSRGVTHLMYVGDDEAVEKVLDDGPSKVVLGLSAVAALLVAIDSNKGRRLSGELRMVMGGIGAWLGYRALKKP